MKLTATGRLILILTGMILFVGLGLILSTFFKSKTTSPKPTTYDECLLLEGSILTRSYPATCVTKDGLRFVEPLSEEELQNLLPPSLPPSGSANVPLNWLTYSDTDYGISFSYPPNWQLNPDSDSNAFEGGEIIDVKIWGETQTEDTELFDGASFTVGKPVTTSLPLDEWINTEFLAPQKDVFSQSPKIIRGVLLGGQEATEVYVCGFGCNTYRFAKVDEILYGIMYYIAGPNKSIYQSQIDQIISSIIINGQTTKKKITLGECKIGGCNPVICQNADEEDAVSICDLKPEYVCYKNAECTVQADGNCGWTQSPEFLSCLRSKRSITY
ncbi:hypothetical protein A2W14_03535 [Candidatus Gottesmanbacteria bacterium RBG_16_37_8]|uniref:Uncharacterized protein n=1 Tax=Candidatus Gottesmanbacteria bacterium RBG_16_37_8 TaxID=1798371 RepID=A0A1F5YSJ7_9BACT|nr:MAG: hypothetical protein A2W14_03535 [Candidatus Gottesmanbacteria bacterium RBG_16_37_8]